MTSARWVRRGLGGAAIFAAVGLAGGLALPETLTDGARFSRYLDDSRLIAFTNLNCGDASQAETGLTAVDPGGWLADTLQQAVAQRSARPADRPPLWVIRDPYPTLSAVAVDMRRDEVAATDKNLFQILFFDRLANTPASAARTEPVRVIGGPRTEIEFQCGLYIDQNSGEIYAVNNDTRNKLVVFSRKASGNVEPDRWLLTPHGTYGIAVDEEAQELFLTIQHDSAVVVYRKDAAGDDTPIRLLQGDRTLLADPHGIAFDPKNKLIFVANYGATRSTGRDSSLDPEVTPARLKISNWPVGPLPGTGRFMPPSITVHRNDAAGDAPPVRIIQGPSTRLNWPTGLAFHPERNELFVANDMDHSILVFDGDADGDVAPLRVLQGERTGLQNPTGVYFDTANREIWVANFGNHSLTVYGEAAQGNSPPLRTIRSSPAGSRALMIGNPGAVDFDPGRRQILVPN